MVTNDAEFYWSPLCELVHQLGCWVRLASSEGGSTAEGRWGQLLIIPMLGYLETSGGPTQLRDVQWVEVSTSGVKGGMAGRPLQLIDMKNEILAGLHETRLLWELRESKWSVERIFVEEPVQVVRFTNPFRPGWNRADPFRSGVH